MMFNRRANKLRYVKNKGIESDEDGEIDDGSSLYEDLHKEFEAVTEEQTIKMKGN